MPESVLYFCTTHKDEYQVPVKNYFESLVFLHLEPSSDVNIPLFQSIQQ